MSHQTFPSTYPYKLGRVALIAALLLLSFWAVLAQLVQADTIPLAGTGCSYAGLNGAIGTANSTPGPDIIDVQCDGETILFAGSALDTVNDDLIIRFTGVTTINANGNQLLQLDNADLTLDNALVTNASAAAGGAIVAFGTSVLTVTNSTFLNNTATNRGGAILIQSDAKGVIINSRFEGNRSTGTGGNRGGGAILTQLTATLYIERSTFFNNEADQFGGAILIDENTTAIITASSFISNAAGNSAGGIGIFSTGPSTVTIFNSTIAQNRAGTTGSQNGFGGGMRIWANAGTTVGITNATIVNNVTRDNGGSDGGGIDADATTTAKNSIIADNTALIGSNCGGGTAITDNGNNLTNNVEPCETTFSQSANLLLAAEAADNGGDTPTVALLAGSPAIDTGDNAACPAADQRGVPRSQGGSSCDIGAFEATPVLGIGKTALQSGPIAPGDTITYTIRITNDGSYPANNTVISDALPTDVSSVVSIEDSTGGGSAGTPPTLYEGFTVAANSTVVVTFSVTANRPLNDGTVITNRAEVTSDEIITSPTAAEHTISVDAKPSVALAKTSAITEADIGDTVNYTLYITNTSNTNITTITVTDSLADEVAPLSTDATLNPDETWTYAATYTIQTTDSSPLVNTAQVDAEDAVGNTAQDTDSYTLTLNANPVLLLTKTGPATATVGETVVYTLSVQHAPASDQSPVTPTTVIDSLGGAASLQSGNGTSIDGSEVWTYTVSYTVLPSDSTPLVNTATITGTGTGGQDVVASDTHSTEIAFAPVLSLTKIGSSSTGVVGSVLTYTYRLEHDSGSDESPVYTVTLVDDLGLTLTEVSTGNGDSTLEFGETWEYTASYTVQSTDATPLVNTATASGQDGNGDTIQATAQHTATLTFTPTLVLEKIAPTTATLAGGADYSIRIYHDVDSDGSAVSIDALVDSLGEVPNFAGGDTSANNLLEDDEVWTYTLSYSPRIDDPDPLLNTVELTATGGNGQSLILSDTASTDLLFEPVLELQKTGPSNAGIGDTVVYTFTLQHAAGSDDSPVSSVNLSDSLGFTPVLVADGNGDTTLDSGETWIYTGSYTIQPTDPAPLINTATATGTDRDGDTVNDSDSHTISLANAPVITLTKQGPAAAFIGQPTIFTITITNDNVNGDGSRLLNINVLDDLTSDVSLVDSADGDTNLDGGESWVYQAVYTPTLSDTDPFSNTASVTAEDSGSTPYSAADTVTTDIEYQPGLTIVKEGPQQASLAQTIIYTVTVSNSSTDDGSPLSNVNVSDTRTSLNQVSNGNGDATLDGGESWVYTASYTIGVADVGALTNTATVSAIDLDGDTIQESDSHTVFAGENAPVLTVSKVGPAAARIGQTVVYTITVGNDAVNGDGSDILNVVITESMDLPLVLISKGDDDDILEGGETWVYTASYTIQPDDPANLQNTVTVSGLDLDDQPVTDEDIHSLTVDAPRLELTIRGPLSAVVVGDGAIINFTLRHAPTSNGEPVSSIVLTDTLVGNVSANVDPTINNERGNPDLLEAGESWNYGLLYTVQPDDYPSPLTHVARVSGLDTLSATVVATESSTLEITYNPVLTVAKVAPATAPNSGAVVYTFTLRHTAASDDSPVGGLSLSDSLLGDLTLVDGDTDNDNLLRQGEVWQYTGNYTVQAGDPDPLTGTVTFTGTDGNADVLTGRVTHQTPRDSQVVANPVLEVVKSGPSQATVGSDITYNITLRHAAASDGSDVSNVSMNDTLGTPTLVEGDSNSDNVLNANETWRYTLAYTVQSGDVGTLVSTATVTALDLLSRQVSAQGSFATSVSDQPPATSSLFLPLVFKADTAPPPTPTPTPTPTATPTATPTGTVVTGPDLVVTGFDVRSNDIAITIENQGTEAVNGAFWIDFYVDPNPVPTAPNEVWSDGRSPQGAVWLVTGGVLPIEPGESLTLRPNDLYYWAEFSNLPGNLPVGTPVYVQVDSANTSTDYGAILEGHEREGLAYNNITSATVSAARGPVVYPRPLEPAAIDLNVVPLRP